MNTCELYQNKGLYPLCNEHLQKSTTVAIPAAKQNTVALL
jgi:hypothetical protein